MTNHPILITGCQRSGTTLLSLILDSHPFIRSIDEVDFRPGELAGYLNDPDLGPYVAFKLPGAGAINLIVRNLPGAKLLWCLRDPRAVVASMIKLSLQSVPWPLHPMGGERDIRNCLKNLPPESIDEVRPVVQHYIDRSASLSTACTRDDLITAAALCWRLKHELLAHYHREGIAFHIFRYETFIEKPRDELAKAVEYLGIPWDDNLLQHHRLHSGVSVGDTVNTRPIDDRSLGKWSEELSAEDMAGIKTICRERAADYGYDL